MGLKQLRLLNSGICIGTGRFSVHRTFLCRSFNRKSVYEKIKGSTVISRSRLVPELQLYLVTPESPYWYLSDEQFAFKNPFWAFFWPGGQVMARWIMDNPHVVKNKTILDFGSGCGATAIASFHQGACCVVANDIDSIAGEAIKLNFLLNVYNGKNNLMHSTIKSKFRHGFHVLTENLLSHYDLKQNNDCINYHKTLLCNMDVIILGDMFYEEDMADDLLRWLKSILVHSPKTRILVGDPGRGFLTPKTGIETIATYNLPEDCMLENYGHTFGSVLEISIDF